MSTSGMFRKSGRHHDACVVSMTLHLTCAFQVIKLSNENVIALFHYFFLQFLHITESVKHHNFKTPCPVHFREIDNF